MSSSWFGSMPTPEAQLPQATQIPKSVFEPIMQQTQATPDNWNPETSPPRREHLSNQICIFFQKRTCRNGESCPFIHEPASSLAPSGQNLPQNASTFPDSRSKNVCRFFLAGTCLKGDLCKFVHDSKNLPSGAPPEQISISECKDDTGMEMKRSTSTVAPLVLSTSSDIKPPVMSADLFKPVSFSDSSITAPRLTFSSVENSLLTTERPIFIDDTPTPPEMFNARSRRFNSNNQFVHVQPEPPTPIVGDDQADEEDLEFAAGSACIVGSLMTMCSEEEIRKRDSEMDVHILESVQDEQFRVRATRRADPDRMIKKYQRSAAGMTLPAPGEVRPPLVLAKTADYLFQNVVDTNLVPPLDVYNFLRDRFRAIRKDFALQDQAETLAAKVHEHIARYFILSHHELCEEKEDDFQKFQNLQQISHTITSLNHYYKDIRIRNGMATPCEAEFYSYEILLNMRDANKLNDRLINLPSYLRTTKAIQDARELVASFRNKNYARFFRLLKERATYLQRCCVHGYLWNFRSRSLEIIYYGMGPVSSTYPIQSLLETLAFDDLDEVLQFCEVHGLTVTNGEIVKTSTPLCHPAKIEWTKSRILIGPPKPSKLAIISGSDSDEAILSSLAQRATSASTIAAEQEKFAEQQKIHLDKINRANAEMHQQKLLEEARKRDEERRNLHLQKLQSLELDFLRTLAQRHVMHMFHRWFDLARHVKQAREAQYQQLRFQIAQRKFSEQKEALSELSRVARLYRTYMYLSRWRVRTSAVQRLYTVALVFRKFKWFQKWRCESNQVRRFKELIKIRNIRWHSREQLAPLPTTDTNLALIMPKSEPPITDHIVDRLRNSLVNTREDIYLHVLISIPAQSNSSFAHIQSFSEMSLLRTTIDLLQVNQTSIYESCSKISERNKLYFRISRTTGAIIDHVAQGIFFLLSYQPPTASFLALDMARFQALLQPLHSKNVIPVILLYAAHSSDHVFEEKVRSGIATLKLPENMMPLTFATIRSTTELKQSLLDHIQNFAILEMQNQHPRTCALESAIPIRLKQLCSLKLIPPDMIKLFNQFLDHVLISLPVAKTSLPRWAFSNESNLLQDHQISQATSLLSEHRLPALPSFTTSSPQDQFGELVCYVRLSFPGIACSEPIVALLSKAFSQGTDIVDLIPLILSSRANLMMVKLRTCDLGAIRCVEASDIVINDITFVKNTEPMFRMQPAPSTVETVNESQSQASKRFRETIEHPDIREIKRKVIESSTLFNSRVQKLLSKCGQK